MAITTPIVETVPLRMDETGTLRVGDSRVTLDVVIGVYKTGATAVDIAEDFDTLELADVHAVIAYYLRHTDEVEAYIAQGRARGEAALRKIAALTEAKGAHERPLARRAAG